MTGSCSPSTETAMVPASGLMKIDAHSKETIASFILLDSLTTIRTLSKAFRETGSVFLHTNQRRIAQLCASESTPLYRYIQFKTAHCFHQGIALKGTGTAFHQALNEAIPEMSVPNQRKPFFSPDKIKAASTAASRSQDETLKKCWYIIRRAIPQSASANPPANNAPAAVIREWMHAHLELIESVPKLIFSRVPIGHIPEEIALFKGLKKLCLADNFLHFFPENIFYSLASLEELDLSSNPLTKLPEKLFQHLPSLKKLNLYNSRGGVYPEKLLQNLSSLEELALPVRHTLPPKFLQGLVSLEKLQLSPVGWNRYEQDAPTEYGILPEELLQNLPSLRELRLQNRSHELIHQNLNNENRVAAPNAINAFLCYRCQSPLAKFYRFATLNLTKEALRPALDALPEHIRNGLFGAVWAEKRPDTNDPQWGEHHVFDDMELFGRALKRYVKESFDRLSPDEKQAVYFNVFQLAHQQEGSDSVNFDEPNWGGVHAFDLPLRLIDAMMMRL